MTAILKNVFENSIGISAIILILMLLRRFLDKRYTTKWQYWVWFILTLRLLLPFDIPLSDFKAPVNIQVSNPVIYQKATEINSIQNGTSQDGSNIYINENDQTVSPTLQNESITNESNMYNRDIFSFTTGLLKRSSFSLGDVLCFVWICGGCIVFVLRIGSYLIARTSLMRSALKTDIDVSEIKHKLNISADVDIYSSYMVTTPVLMGIFNPTIIIPENSANDVHLQLALYHELVHYKRCDIGFKLMLFVATCAYWYNPCVWLMNFLAMEDIELSCDETIYRSLNNDGKSIYGESILMFAAKKKEKLLYSTSFSNDKKTLAHRIKNIFATQIKSNGIAALSIILVLAVVSSVLVSCTDKNTVNTQFENAQNEIGPEDENAMLLIKLYEKYSAGADYQPSDFSGTYSDIFDCHYYIFKPLVWALLESKDNEVFKVYAEDDSEEYQYYISLDSYKAVSDMLFETEEHIGEEYIDNFDGQVCIYSPEHINIQTRFGGDYDVLLTADGKRVEANGDVIYSFERRHNSDIIGYVDYTLSPIESQAYPDIVEKVFSLNEPLYAIKSVKSYEALLPGEEKLIQISTAEELVQMSEDYAKNGNSYFNYTYVLTNDIDMSNVDNFLPIGRNHANSADDRDITESGFCSTFDGQGYTIKNVTISNYNHSEYYDEFTGFFIKISKHGVVKNLNIENLHITSEWGCGGFAGTISGTVENCHVSGTIDGKSGIGGFVNSIVGVDNTHIKNCSADVDIYGESSIAGFAACSSYNGYENYNASYTIENCISYGSVNSRKISSDNYNYHSNPNYIAGFVSRGTLGNFINCHVQTPISLQHTANVVGGFAADVENATFTNCTYNPDTTGNWYIIGTFNLQDSHGDYRSFEFTEAVK